MTNLEATGKTIEEAIQAALAEMKVSRGEVEVEVLDEGSKGFFGIFGTKAARVKITEIDTIEKRAESFLKKVLKNMGIQAELIIKQDEHSLQINMEGKTMGILIGHRGETLDSLQYLTSLVVNKDQIKYVRVALDTENYRSKREETLERLARKLAMKAKKTGHSIILEPMNPYERRILHATLQDNPYVQTHSEGEEPNRKVVITLK